MHPASANPSAVDVAIIGAGFCGSMVAVNLLRKAKEPIDVALIERSGSFARGLAYGTTDPSHLLNVPAGKMGAFPDDHEHFYRWGEGMRWMLPRIGLTPSPSYRPFARSPTRPFASSTSRPLAVSLFGFGPKNFMMIEKNTGVRKIPKKVTPIIPLKTAVPNA